MTGRLAVVVSLAVAFVLAIAPATVRADDLARQVPREARDLAERGRAFHAAGDYMSAIVAFKQAYAIAPSPGLLFNLAQAYRLAGDCADAAWMYRNFLASSADSDQRAVAQQQLATVEQCGRGPGLRLAAPVVAAPVLAAALTSSTARGGATHATAPLEARATTTSDNDGVREMRLGVGLAIGGSALLAGAAYFALDAHDAANSVSATYAKGGTWADVADADARGQRDATLAKVLGATGAVAIASGGVCYYLGRRAQQVYERAQHVAVHPTLHGAEVSVAWRF